MLAPNTQLQNRYTIDRLIKKGGMGAVYLANDDRLSHKVAVKQIIVNDDDELFRTAFEREAKMLARLRHEGLPKVTDHFTEENIGQFLVMEYVSGKDLTDLLKQRQTPFPIDEVLFWGDELLEILDYLHKQNPPIIHRDIKPTNLKLTDKGKIILLDFGLAKDTITYVSRHKSSDNLVGHTPNYAPIEQIMGDHTTEQTDIYSLTATLYHLLTNQKPEDSFDRFRSSVDPLRPAKEFNAGITEALNDVLKKGLSLNREDRPVSAVQMRQLLRIARMKPGPIPPPPSPRPEPQLQPQPNPDKFKPTKFVYKPDPQPQPQSQPKPLPPPPPPPTNIPMGMGGNFNVFINGKPFGQPMTRDEIKKRADNWRKANCMISPVGTNESIPLDQFLSISDSKRVHPTWFDLAPTMPSSQYLANQNPPAPIQPQQPQGQPAFVPSVNYLSQAKSASYTLYLTLLLVSLILILFPVAFAVAEQNPNRIPVAFYLLALIGSGGLIATFVLGLVYLYRAWALIQSPSARTTQGKAVGFLFIPFFNYYWIFQAVYGWAQDYDNYIKTYKHQTPPPVSLNLFLAFCISNVAGSLIPFLIPLTFILWFILMHQMCTAINFMAELQQQRQAPSVF